MNTEKCVEGLLKKKSNVIAQLNEAGNRNKIKIRISVLKLFVSYEGQHRDQFGLLNEYLESGPLSVSLNLIYCRLTGTCQWGIINA
jgi:hypothetical protein